MATDIIARGMITEYKSGTNISFKENDDGSVTISASGDVSSEDTVARETIDNHKLDKNNPHNVTAEQIGLNNVDNTADLNKPISTAVQTALDKKADKTTATKDSNGLMSAADKAKLDGIEENANHTIVDSEISETSENPIQNKAVAKAIKGGETLSGSTGYTVNDSVEYPLVGLKVFGKSTQDGTPTAENPVDIVSVGDSGSVKVTACGKNLIGNTSGDITIIFPYAGIDFTKNSDGSITCSGNQTDHAYYMVAEDIKIDFNSKYILSGNKTNNNNEWGYSLFLHLQIGANSAYIFNNTPDDVEVDLSQYQNLSKLNCIIRIGKDAPALTDPITFYPMIRNVGTDNSYEPYKGNTASISSALPLCGIPVESGGNYTDSNGQQWACDELIYNADGTGKIIKRTAKIDSYNGETVSGVYCSSTGGLDTGATVIYQIDTSQEIELTASEMVQLRQLQTYNGTTNISNDKGAVIEVGYCTNKALSSCVAPITTGLQKQIDDLKAAILSLGGNV